MAIQPLRQPETTFKVGTVCSCALALLFIHLWAGLAVAQSGTTAEELEFGEPSIPAAQTIGGFEEIEGLPIVGGSPIEGGAQIYGSGSGGFSDPSVRSELSPDLQAGDAYEIENANSNTLPPQDPQNPWRGYSRADLGPSQRRPLNRSFGGQIPEAPQLPAGRFSARDDVEVDDEGNRLEVIRQLHPNGKPQIIRRVTQDAEGNYYNQGLWTLLDPNGILIAEGHYNKGLLQGKWKRKHAANAGGLFAAKPFNLFQGPFTSTAEFNEGELDGTWTIIDSLNRPIFQIPYTDGQRNGKAKWWYPNNLPMREVTFREGTLDGLLKEWNEKNELKRQERYVEGKKIIRETSFYRPNRLEAENFYLDSKLELDGKDSWWEAKPAQYVPVGEKIRSGQSLILHQNGQPKMRGQYRDDVRHGRFLWWHSNGNKELDGAYENGQPVGVWTWRHSNGMKKISGEYKDGVPEGVWTSWNSQGRVTEKQNLTELREQEEKDREERRKVELQESKDMGETVIEDGNPDDVGPTMDDDQSDDQPNGDDGPEVDPEVDPFKTPGAGGSSEVKPEEKEEGNPVTGAGESSGQSETLPPPQNTGMEEVTGIEEDPPEFREPVPGGQPRDESPEPDPADEPSAEDPISDEDPFETDGDDNDDTPAEFQEPTHPIQDPYNDDGNETESDPVPGLVPESALEEVEGTEEAEEEDEDT